MDKKTILAVLLCIAVWLVWQALFVEPVKPMPDTPDAGRPDAGSIATEQERPDAGQDGSGAETAAEDVAATPSERTEERLVALENELFKAVFSTRSAVLRELQLKGFKERDERKKAGEQELEDLVSTAEEINSSLNLRFRSEKTSFPWPAQTDWEVVESDSRKVKFRYSDPGDPRKPIIFKTFEVGNKPYLFEMEVEVQNRSESSMTEQIAVELFAGFQPQVSTGCGAPASAPRQPTCLAGEEVLTVDPKPGEGKTGEPNIFWTGINEQYFLLAIVPQDVEQSMCELVARHDKRLVSNLVYPQATIPPGGSVSHRFRIFAGPKQLKLLEAITAGPGDEGRNARLEQAVDFGWFAILALPMLWLLKFFESFLGNWGVAIIFLTIVIKLLLLPLTQKSMKSMREMAKLKPLLDDLKKRCGEDKQRLNQEMMNLYKVHKINPMGGCLPMLVQMPFWIALYRMLYSAVELYQTPFIPGWIDDLSFRDPYFIMPIVLGLAMFLQQKMTPTTADSQQAKMMLYMMPAFMTFIMLYLPAGLVLYIFVNSLLSIGHQVIYNRRNPLPGSSTGGATAAA